MNKLLVICGPTATGKTKLGINLARKFNGEVVSADSRQVYRGMDIGTGKDVGNSKFEIPAFAEASAGRQNSKWFGKLTILSKAERQNQNSNFQIGYYEIEGIKTWLLDIVKPDYRFNVADYKKCADLVIEDILKRGKLPIVVGGTGFYIKAITDGIETIGIEPDWELRNELQRSTVSELQRRLKDLDPERSRGMNESDKKNPRRLIRAIEIAERGLGKGFPGSNREVNKLFIGLTAPFKFLYERIDRRVDERVKKGAEDEIKKLFREGYNWENSILGVTIGYREWKDFFENEAPRTNAHGIFSACFGGTSNVPATFDCGGAEIRQSKSYSHSSPPTAGSSAKADKATREEVIQKWKFAEHGYSRRQMTWFKKTLRQGFDGELSRTAQGKLLRQACTEQSRSTQDQWFDICKEGWEGKVEKLVKAWYS